MNYAPKPEVEAVITLLPKGESSRTKPLNWSINGYFGCPMVLPSGNWDCRIIFPSETAPIELGSTTIGQLQFLSPGAVLPQIKVGTEFRLWDVGIFAYGRVIKLL
jgi:hypothetical protein